MRNSSLLVSWRILASALASFRRVDVSTSVAPAAPAGAAPLLAACASVLSMRKVADTLWCMAFISERSLAWPSNASSRANSIW